MKEYEFNYNYNVYDTIRKNIKKYRKERKITSAKLAELVDLSHDFIRQIESEKVAYNFSVDTLYRISLALGVSLDDLVRKENDWDKFKS
ncbi:MAG: helix-turn-helix transcriptional regulator [Bacilli bacterium]|nr:helix-turn-helix transcriptional regulator [Bacilli bacterium]